MNIKERPDGRRLMFLDWIDSTMMLLFREFAERRMPAHDLAEAAIIFFKANPDLAVQENFASIKTVLLDVMVSVRPKKMIVVAEKAAELKEQKMLAEFWMQLALKLADLLRSPKAEEKPAEGNDPGKVAAIICMTNEQIGS